MGACLARASARPDEELTDAIRASSGLRNETALLGTLVSLMEGYVAKEGDEAVLRDTLQLAQKLVGVAQRHLIVLLPQETATCRAGYLQTLDELCGEPAMKTQWEDEWLELRAEALQMQFACDPTDPRRHWTAERTRTFVREENTIEIFQASKRQQSIDDLVKRGWSNEDARVYAVLSVCGAPIARALRACSLDYAASTFALCGVLFNRGSSSPRMVPPVLYRHLRGAFSLSATESGWGTIEQVDGTGFCGLVSYIMTFADCDSSNFGPLGYLRRFQDKAGARYIAEESDIVAFVSTPQEDTVAHAAVLTYTASTGCFPPNTLFRLRKVQPPGSWEAPGGLFPNQRLLVVTATYLPPVGEERFGRSTPSKLCGDVTALTYGDRVVLHCRLRQTHCQATAYYET